MIVWDVLFTNVHLATMAGGYGEIRDAAIAVKDGRIAWLGPAAALPADARAATVHDGEGCWLTPGLVDCHTHIVHAGNR
ncbi:MAG TPA: imidazolonepropionase, partial [Duganella sp.]